LINNKLERIWKEEEVVQLRKYSGTSVEGLMKNTKALTRIAGKSAEIRTNHLPNTV
jgi:hypothetical protein